MKIISILLVIFLVIAYCLAYSVMPSLKEKWMNEARELDKLTILWVNTSDDLVRYWYIIIPAALIFVFISFAQKESQKNE